MGKFNKKKNTISQEKAEEITGMSSDELLREIVAQRADIKALDKDRKNSSQISNLQSIVEEAKRQIEAKEEVRALKDEVEAKKLELEELIEKHIDASIASAQEDLKALKGGFCDERKQRVNRLEFAMDELEKRVGTRGNV